VAQSFTLSASQLLYSRVEAEYSPKGRSGYQVVFHSPSLSATEVSAIERRVQCFQGDGDRLQFFTLETGRVAIVYSTIIEPDMRINDKEGRRGAFIAHALIFEPNDFARVRNDPFLVLEAERESPIFVNEPQVLADEIGAKKATIPIMVSATPRRTVEPPSGWSAPELAKLEDWMERGRTDQTLMFLADATQTEELMSVIHFFASPQERLALSFDTAVDGCQPTPGMYWAVGGRKRLSNAKIIIVEYDKPRLPDIPPTAPKAVGYGTWLKHSLKESVTNTIEMIPTAQFLAGLWAENRWQNPDFELSAVATQQFVQFHWGAIFPRIISALEIHLGSAMAQNFAQALSRLGWQPQTQFRMAIEQQVDVKHLAHYVYHWLLMTNTTDLANEADKLLALADVAQYLPLRILALLNQKKRLFNRDKQSEALSQTLDYAVNTSLQNGNNLFEETLLQLCPKFTTPDRLVTQFTAPFIAQHLTGQNYPEDIIINVIDAFLDVGAGRHLAPLTEFVSRLSSKSLQQIQRKFKNTMPAPQFAQAVDMRLRQKF